MGVDHMRSRRNGNKPFKHRRRTHLSRVHVHNFHPFASRSYAKKSCPYVPRFDLKFNTRYIVLWSNLLCLNVLGYSNPLLRRFMYVMDTSMAGCEAEIFHSYKS